MLPKLVRVAYGVNRSRWFHSVSIKNRLPLVAVQQYKDKNGHQRQQERHYKNFGHKPEEIPRLTKYWISFLTVGFVLSTFNFKWLLGFLSLKFLPTFPAKSEMTKSPEAQQAVEEGAEDKSK